MNRLVILLTAIALLFTLSGCREMDHLYAYFQYTGPKLSFSPGRMTMTFGDGRYDIRKAIDKQEYTGSVAKGKVTVDYIPGTELQAEKIADDFNRMYDLARERLGIDWAFDLTVKFVDASDVPDGWFYAEKVRSNRKITFPLVVRRDKEPVSSLVASVVAHEITEASMFYPHNRRQMLLGDAWLGSFVIPYHTRWFRDGLADYAGNLFVSEVLSREPVLRPDFERLAQVRESVLDWQNPGGRENYGAALALVYEITFKHGEDAIPRIFDEISKGKTTGGTELRNAVMRATGTDLRKFLSTYQTPWLGFSVMDSKDGKVIINRTWKETPASRWDLKKGDRIVEFAGEPVRSSIHFRLLQAQQTVGGRVEVIIDRAGKQIRMNMKMIAYPAF